MVASFANLIRKTTSFRKTSLVWKTRLESWLHRLETCPVHAPRAAAKPPPLKAAGRRSSADGRYTANRAPAIFREVALVAAALPARHQHLRKGVDAVRWGGRGGDVGRCVRVGRGVYMSPSTCTQCHQNHSPSTSPLSSSTHTHQTSHHSHHSHNSHHSQHHTSHHSHLHPLVTDDKIECEHSGAPERHEPRAAALGLWLSGGDEVVIKW